MILPVPLPAWRVLAGLAGTDPEPAELAAPWLRPGDASVWYSRSSWALAGLAAAWQRLNGRPPVLWLPAYFCNGTLDPLRRTSGTVLRFVPVAGDLSIDWAAAERLYGDEKPDLVLAPHFFGIAQNLRPARELCRRTGAELIEDCAHVLRPGAGLGDAGEYVLWSPHKLLAVPQGGLLVVRPGARLAAIDLAASGAVADFRTWLAKRVVQKLAPVWLLPPSTRGGPQHFLDDPVTASMPDTPRLNPFAARLLRAASAEIEQVAVERQRLAAALRQKLSRRGGWQPLPITVDCVPYRLVLRCDDATIAQDRFRTYRAAGLVVESWPDMPPEVTAEPQRFGAAMELRRTILCFAVHQGLSSIEVLSLAGRDSELSQEE